ncbi:hypothetical protein [Fictibacillus fluitans]|uniref:Uncharacterized protein n=1 Tax=Fictibacillus fluitans TaxID=3058422 RepID=A0ABT8I105_9BACL|nr:hypothetical protein [Fictibacillus sp. NE201]MDN4526705.1 hypothetical protein [Fictibacillus sp. NE201]
MLNWLLKLAQYKQTAQDLEQKVQQLEELIKQSANQENHPSSAIHYHVHIEKLELQNPVLENLSFTLDNLDIEELSGALNLGNNFGVTVGEKQLKEKISANRTKNAGESSSKSQMKRSSSGLSFKFGRTDKEG